MKFKFEYLYTLLKKQNLYLDPALNSVAEAFAPSNIALIKYWGKRDKSLNLPNTSSLSISLANKGTKTRIRFDNNLTQDLIYLNNTKLEINSNFYLRIKLFLDLFRQNNNNYFIIHTESNIPIASGLASSASGFAALTLAMSKLYNWNISLQKLSTIARLGSGSATRSLWHGFVEWHQGENSNGSDSYGELLDYHWHDFCIGLLIFNAETKLISSRDAMECTIKTSRYYKLWPEQVMTDLLAIKPAIKNKDFSLVGTISERNAIAMHATMHTSWPPVNYNLSATMQAMQTVWQARRDGLEVYFTQDAGPNLKLLFLEQDLMNLKKYFANLILVKPFAMLDLEYKLV